MAKVKPKTMLNFSTMVGLLLESGTGEVKLFADHVMWHATLGQGDQLIVTIRWQDFIHYPSTSEVRNRFWINEDTSANVLYWLGHQMTRINTND